MQRFELGRLPGQDSMLVFHALAGMGVESLVIVSPATPIVSIGYFQDAEQEIDLDYCRRAGLPVMRREVGGGATYLDADQIFYQVILRRDNPLAQRRIQEIYEWLSQAPIETYGAFGIKTFFRPVNDIVTDRGRKIAGEGGADIGPCMVFVGGILLDFNYEAMSRALNVPDEKFRDKVYKTMKDNLTTMRQELGQIPPREEIVRVLVESFEKLLGPTKPAGLKSNVREAMISLEDQFCSDAFLYKKTPKVPQGVKIREGVELRYGLHKAKGGLIRTAQEVIEDRFGRVTISGDFSFFPKENLADLEHRLIAQPRNASAIRRRVEAFYEANPVESPGVDATDYVKALDLTD